MQDRKAETGRVRPQILAIQKGVSKQSGP
jgi:hypothetical protein